jgi:hypothetical protein
MSFNIRLGFEPQRPVSLYTQNVKVSYRGKTCETNIQQYTLSVNRRVAVNRKGAHAQLPRIERQM